MFRFNKMVSYISNYTQAGKIYVIAWMYLSAGQWCDSIDVAALSHYWWKMSPMLCNMSYKCIFHQIGQTVVCFEMWNTWTGSEFKSNDFWWFFQLISSHPSPDNWRQTNKKRKTCPNQKSNNGIRFSGLSGFLVTVWLKFCSCFSHRMKLFRFGYSSTISTKVLKNSNIMIPVF